MRTLFLVFFISIFSLSFSVNAETPYSAKILYGAEYDRLENNLTKTVGELREQRSKIDSAKKKFEETRHLVDLLFVYALEKLHHEKKSSQFKRMAQILDSDELRETVYYPVSRVEGISKKVKWIKLTDTECMDIRRRSSIKTGLFVSVELGAFNHLGLGNRHLTFEDVYKNRSGNTTGYTLALFEFDNDDPINQIATSFTEAANESVKFFNCDNVQEYRNLEKKYSTSKKRYLKLAKILDREPKDFDEKKESTTVSEVFNGIGSDPTSQKAADLNKKEKD